MKYELDLFFRIIHSDLLEENNDSNGFTDHITFLKHRFTQCLKHYKVHFKITASGDYHLVGLKEYSFLDLQGMIYQEPSVDSDPPLLDAILASFLSVMPISQDAITKAVYIKNEEEIELEVTAQIDFTTLKPAEARFHYYRTLLHDEVERIKRAFHHQSFSLQSEKQIELFIQNYQKELENLVHSLFIYLDEEDLNSIYALSKQYTLIDIYKIVYLYLEKLQRHLERYFTKYLDVNISIPYRTRLLGLPDINIKIQLVISKLLEEDVDEKLLKILKKMLVKLTHVKLEESISYQMYSYLKKLLDELYILATRDDKLNNQQLIKALYGLNVNSIDFFTYIISQMESVISGLSSNEDKIALLYLYQKIYRQYLVRIQASYQKGLGSIKEQVLHWIKEEICFLKKTAKKEGLTPKKDRKDKPSKITTQLSVPQLAYVLKIMYELELITAESQWEMFRFLQENVRSKRTETISANSLNNKYYHVEEATKTTVKDLLLKMIHYINKAK